MEKNWVLSLTTAQNIICHYKEQNITFKMDPAEEPEKCSDEDGVSHCLSLKSDVSMEIRQHFSKEDAERYIESILSVFMLW